jgi:glycosyltransferase involved in cell wall biosynthesis
MKVLHIIPSLCSGGAEVFVADLLIAQASHENVQMILLTYAGVLDHKGEQLFLALENAGITQIHLNIRKNRNKWIIPFAFRRQLSLISPDIVHSHMLQCEFFLVLALLGNKKPLKLVRTLHDGTRNRRFPEWCQRAIARKFLTVGCSKSVMESDGSLIPADTYVNNGINLQKFSQPLPTAGIRNELRLNSSSLLFVCVGSMHRFPNTPKGQDLIINALSLLKSSDIHVAFLGDGEAKIDLLLHAERGGVAENCHFLGIRGNVLSYLHEADAFVLPSRHEGLSIAAIEAACMGLPLILSKIPAFLPFASSSVIFCSDGDPANLADAILQTSNNIDFLRMEAQKNVVTYKHMFDINRTSAEYFSLYVKVQ